MYSIVCVCLSAGVVNGKSRGGGVVGARLGLRNGGGHVSRNSHQITTPRSGGAGGGGDGGAKRVLSAGRLKMNELRNRVAELNAQVVELQQENKLVS